MEGKGLLLFLLKKESEILDLRKKIPKEFCALNDRIYQKAEKYSELEYRMSSTEFRMEFYLKGVQLFCKLGDSLLNVFAGGKPLPPRMVNSPPLELKCTILCYCFCIGSCLLLIFLVE